MIVDARTKIILVLFASITYGMHLSIIENAGLVLGLSLLFWFSGKKRMAVFGGLSYALFSFLLSYLTLPFALSHLLVVLSATWVPMLAGHFLLMTTSSYQLIQGLRKWHLPEGFLITFAVMLRFLPLIKQEARMIVTALRIRGIFLTKRAILYRPFLYIELFLVPLMLSLLRQAQELTVASLTKGVALSGQSSEYIPSRWKLVDWSVCVCCLLFLLFVK